jgi:hypothetical protein
MGTVSPITDPRKSQRQVSPLPRGRYWLDLSGQVPIEDFDQWLREVGTDQVKVESSSLDRDASPVNEFIIFTVVGDAAFFPAERLGFPGFAPATVTDRQDILGAPAEEAEPGDQFKKILITVGFAVTLVAAGHVLYLYAKRRALEG